MTERDPLLTISGSPGLYRDPDRPDHGVVATMTLVPAVEVSTADDRPGAEPVDAVLAALLGRGFALVSELDIAALLALPTPPEGAARLDARTGGLWLEVGLLAYDGDVGSSPPPGWAAAIARRGWLVVLVASGVDLTAPDRTARIARARAEGRLVGAQVPTRVV